MFKQKDFPRKLCIGESIWMLKFVRRIPDCEDGKTLGLCDPFEHTIYIRMGQTPAERLITVFHEVGHAYEEEYRREIPHGVIEWYAHAMAKLLIDNAA